METRNAGREENDRENQTWELVDKPINKEVVGVKWIFKTKLNPNGSIQNHKVRLVAIGYSAIWSRLQ